MAVQSTKGESKKMTNQSVIFVGEDDGHDSMKLAIQECELTAEGSLIQKGETRYFQMPSKAVRGTRVLSLKGGDNESTYRIPSDNGDNDETFTVTDGLAGNDVVDTRSITYPHSAVNRVLVHDALIRAGLGGKEVHLVTGLPVSDYYTNDGPNIEFIEGKRANISSGAIAPLGRNVSLAKISSHLIACEGLSAVYDMSISDDGSDDPAMMSLLQQGPVGVIDIGGKTIDLAVVYLDRGTHQIDRQRTKSISYGMLRLMDLISDEIRNTYGVDYLPPRVMHRILVEKTMLLSGDQVDVSKQVDKAIAVALPEISQRIRSVWQQASDMSKVIVVGGGAHLLATPLQTSLYKHASSLKQPEYANARGMLKVSMRQYILQQRKNAE